MNRPVGRPITRRGRLSPEEIETIVRLADKGKTAWQVAADLGRDPSAVSYHFMRLGYTRPRTAPIGAPVIMTRNGVELRRFTAEEDALIKQARLEGLGLKEIGKLCGERFGYVRRAHTISAALMRLAVAEEHADGD